MSGFLGIYNRNGNSVDKNIANRMLETISDWEPDEHDLWLDGPVALGHAMLWNTPESKYEHLPLKKDIYILTMDARIDNREELAKEIELPDLPMSEIGDSEFVLAAYRKWGEDCPKHLLGDFAFAIWDKEKQKLFCVRDHIGIKPLFYFQSDAFFIFANDIAVLLKHPDIPKEFDDLTLAYFVKDAEIFTKNTTFFESIKILPPATSMMVDHKDIQKNIYWKIEDTPPIRYKDLQEYAEKLRELFDDAVKVRLRSDYTMASHLSGGIDSSPIAVFAARELAKQKKSLHAFNWIDIPEDPDQYEFEVWNFSRRIASGEENIIHEEFSIDPAFIVQQYKTHNIFTQGAMYLWEEYYVQERMKNMNARVMLSGWGGDELITHNGYSFMSGLSSQKKVLSIVYYFFWEIVYDKQYSINWLRSLVKSVLPEVMLNHLQKIAKPDIETKKEYEMKYDTYLTDSFKKYVESKQTIGYPTEKGVRHGQFIFYNLGHIQERIESWALSGASKRMEYRYPLLDRRIVEFAVGIPESMFYPLRGKERPLFKTSIADLLPSDIVWFDKQAESKVNKTYKKRYTESLTILQRELSHQRSDYMTNDTYFDYDIMLSKFLNFDFKKSDVYEVDNILAPFLYFSAKEKLKDIMR